MRTVGIICECNPFHAGHRHLIEKAKCGEECCVIALMSGYFVQRGDPAILDPFTRAELLLDGGADVVLKLPFPFSSSGASYFATAGVRILESLGVNELWFGSECGSLERLEDAAEKTLLPEFLTGYRELCLGGIGTAAAFRNALGSVGSDVSLCTPNDLLGISYLRAIKTEKAGMKPQVILRTGSGFHATVTQKETPSAEGLRKLWKEKGLEAISPFFSQRGQKILQIAEENGLAPVSFETLLMAEWLTFRVREPESFDEIAELQSGFGRRLCEIAAHEPSPARFLSAASSRQIPDARILRALLFGEIGVTKDDLNAIPAYTELLGFSETGRKFLAAQRKGEGIPIVGKPSAIPRSSAAERQRDLERKAFALFSACLPVPRPADALLRPSPVRINKKTV